MDQQQQQRVNEAAEKFTGALTESFRAVSERGVSAQEQGARLAEDFFSRVVGNPRTQAEDNRQATQQVAEQQQRQREAAQALTQESVNAYMGFVNSMFSYWQGGIEQAQRNTGTSGGSAGESSEGGNKEELKRIVRESVERSEGQA